MTVYEIARSLPEPSRLREVCRALATLDAVLSPHDWDSRYYSYNTAWAPGEHMASMRNGSGDEYSIVFSAAGVWIRGFDHESPMSPFGRGGSGKPWPGVVDTVPEVFRSYAEIPAFAEEPGDLDATVCLWREPTDDGWQAGDIVFPEDEDTNDPDGANTLFELLADPTPEAYAQFAEDYWEAPVDLAAVRHVYAQLPLTEAVVVALNPGATLALAVLTADLDEIGYPYERG